MHSESRKETAKGTLAARAQMVVKARLGWLAGFPLGVTEEGVRWMSVPAHGPAVELEIGRQHLSQATYALNKLRGELAEAVERLVEEPEPWLDSVEQRLELLKGPVHHGTPLPSHLFREPFLSRGGRDEAARLAGDEPGLAPFLDALSWAHAGHPDQVRAGLELVAGWSGGVEVLKERYGRQRALVVLLRLLQLALDHGGSRVQALADCLFDERVHGVALEDGASFCALLETCTTRRSRDPVPTELPSGSLGGELVGWCEDLVRESYRAEQKALELFELATPLPLVAEWQRWWAVTGCLLQEVKDLRAVPYERDSRHGLRARLEAHRQAAPPELHFDVLVEALRQPPSDRTEALLGMLAEIPAEAVPGRLQLFLYWNLLGRDGGIADSRIALLLAGFARYLRRARLPVAALLEPWEAIANTPHRHFWDDLESELLARAHPRRTVLAAYDFLADLATEHGGLSRDAAVKAVDLFLQVSDAEKAARFFASLWGQGKLKIFHSAASTTLALRLCEDCPERFAEVLEALTAQEERVGLMPSRWPQAVLGPLGTGPVGELVRESIVTRQLSQVLSCGTKLVLLDAAGIRQLPQPVLGEPVAPAWIERYPPALHPALCRLAAVLDDAERKVERLLAEDLPSTERLQREIAALEERLVQMDESRKAPLATRLANLRSRLVTSPVPGAGRIERLRSKLDRAWGRAVLERWDREIDERMPAALCSLLGIGEAPSWLTGPVPLSLLAAATRLRPIHRQLAYRLFRLRCGPPPWDLRDEPENRAFVASRPEIDWRPWIEGLGTVTVAAGSRPLRLALEDDPLEIFRMGAHFGTCLSPGSINYFSVFANAADVNKRVLYARDPAGKVVGRCLMALTAGGELLTFEPYCHDGNLGFDQISSDFADQLAGRMGVRRVASGRVPPLVAADWYDDGPWDLGRRFAALEEGSALRHRLAKLRPGELLGELRRALKPAPLDETTLPLVLALPELAERPELVVPLVRPAAECRALPADAVATAVHLALQAGSADLVRRFFLKRLIETVRGFFRIPAPADSRMVDALVQIDPARLLAVLRETRYRSCRDWLDETDGYRLEAAARALEALYRARQAQAVWQRLATSTEVAASGELRQRAAARVPPTAEPRPAP